MKSESSIHITAVFLAAGTSSRMGEANKLLLNFNDKPMVVYCFQKLKKSSINQIIIVTGYEHTFIQKALKNHHNYFIHNEDYENGMTGSIQKGINAEKHNTDAYLICLSDMPFLNTSDYDFLLDEFRRSYQNKSLIIVPNSKGRSGNPVIFSKHFKDEILSHKSPNGCKEIIKSNANAVIKVLLENESAFGDIDTMEDYTNYIDRISKYFS